MLPKKLRIFIFIFFNFKSSFFENIFHCVIRITRVWFSNDDKSIKFFQTFKDL